MKTKKTGNLSREEKKVIFASSLGTVFEWYDFYLYGSLAAIISKQFFSGVNETTGFIFALLAFAAGFAVRPFGAMVFGRIGDLMGRKNTFLITIIIMGVSTAIVGMLPSYEAIGIAAPAILISLRLLQGLALGGEYGGAAIYVAEHAPRGQRGFFTSWIQTTATMGLFMSLLVILVTRNLMGNQFEIWGWRIPFLISIFLLAISVYIRLQLNESPVFQKMKAEGKSSSAPLTESFLRWGNLRNVILILLGGTSGQAVVWYTGQFYALFFLLKILKVDPQTTNYMIAGSLLIATPFFVIFGKLSDRIGRKPIIIAGCILAALTYFPIFKGITEYANPAVFEAQEKNPVTVISHPDGCSFQFDPVGKAKFNSSCDIAKNWLAKNAVPYKNESAAPGTPVSIRIGSTMIHSFDGRNLSAEDFKRKHSEFQSNISSAVQDAGYPSKADPSKINYYIVILLLTVLVLYVTMVYGPIAAWLVEMFPARIRYTSMSLPYHIGNGWFGGFLPTISFAMVVATGDIYFGLWYPVGVALMTAVLGTFALPETKDREIHHDA
ncbi:MAG: MHS family MFS transporter [Spirochaetia bacterium]|nr:MHS family MFS transporter [Spirochaetia bacterium]